MTYERNSVGILDLLGDVGGVMGLLNMFISDIGTFFSAKFFSAAIASLYIKKEPKNKNKKSKNFKNYMTNNFSPIKISTF